MPKYRLRMVMPKCGRMEVPSALVTVTPFQRCPACEGERVEETRLRVVFACGMTQMVTDGDEFAVIATCPHAMTAVQDLKARRLSRGEDTGAMHSIMLPLDGFKTGDRVSWISQSAGKETTKKGVVAAVVPPDARPEEFIPGGMRKNSTNGYGKSRPHTTYLVRVLGKGTMVYWPRVHCLEKL